MLQPVGFRVVAAAKTSYPCSLIWNKGRKEQAAGSLPLSRAARPGLETASGAQLRSLHTASMAVP